MIIVLPSLNSARSYFSGLGVFVAIVIAAVSSLSCHAQGLKDSAAAGGDCATQDAPVRRRSEVEACGRWSVNRYSDQTLAEFGILDVTKSPYLADRTGNKDSTQALQRAMQDARDARLIAYLPAGSYKVSHTLTCIQGVVQRDANYLAVGREKPNDEPVDPSIFNESMFFPCVLMGSRSGQRSKIILAPASAGFGDTQNPKPVLYFWTRTEDEPWFPPSAWTPLDPSKEYSADSFYNMIVDVDISLGKSNPGAIGIQLFGAQMSAIEDVTVDANGAFAGIKNPPAGGGGMHGLTVIGGRYGVYIRVAGSGLDSAQPVYVISNLTLKGQSVQSILYSGRGPLTVVGGRIEGAGVRSESSSGQPWDGAMNFVDTAFRARAGACAISSDRSVYLRNVYFEQSEAIACVEGKPQLKATPGSWTHIEEYVAGAKIKSPQWLGGSSRQDVVYVDGRVELEEMLPIVDTASPPADLQARHAWSRLPSWDGPGVANVRGVGYGAKADGQTDDWPAIQRAIDENGSVFLPKGVYRLSHPLVLKSDTRLFGVSNLLSVLSPMWSPAYDDPNHGAPLIDTVNDAGANTVLALLQLRVPVIQPGVYALRWRAGRHSVVRDVSPLASFWEPGAPPGFYPMVRIEGSGGGRWYDLETWHWWSQGPDYRHLLVEGTREPLSFYMLNPEHAASEAQVEFHDARNVSVYSLKAEGQFTTLWMRDCRNIAVYGYGGVSDPRPNRPIFRIDASNDFLLAEIDPDHVVVDAFRKLPQWDGLGAHADPTDWILIGDSADTVAKRVVVRGVDQVVLYKRGRPANLW